MSTVLALALVMAAMAEPTAIVERVVTIGGATRRVSVFRDGTVVLAMTSPEGKKEIVRRKLSEIELEVLKQVVSESHVELSESPLRPERVEGPAIELRLTPEGRGPLKVRLPLGMTAPLAVGKVNQALDELEKVLGEGPAEREDLSTWAPETGDRLELDDGTKVVVLEVTTDGTDTVVRVGEEDAPVSIYFELSELRRRAVRRVHP